MDQMHAYNGTDTTVDYKKYGKDYKVCINYTETGYAKQKLAALYTTSTHQV